MRYFPFAFIICLQIFLSDGFIVGRNKKTNSEWVPPLKLIQRIDFDCNESTQDRRNVLLKTLTLLGSSIPSTILLLKPEQAWADADIAPRIIIESPTGEVKKLFDEARVLESQGNIFAAQRIYTKVTKISPNFIYGHSNLGNTLVALGSLDEADDSYTTAIRLCNESLLQRGSESSELFSSSCKRDLYLFYLNRGTVRLNNKRPKEALDDLNQAVALRGRPDAILIQNRARANEMNGYYTDADTDYTMAISMTSNEVTPLWLRAALVKFELGNIQQAWELALRVANKFPEAPEVRAALATFLWARGEEDNARKKFLEIPDRARKNYSKDTYLRNIIMWGPQMRTKLSQVVTAVGDYDRKWDS